VGNDTLSRYREVAGGVALLVQTTEATTCPEPSKYNLLQVPNVIPYCGDVGDVVARISAITEAMILVAALWEVALRFVNAATGIKPKTAIRQKAAIPRARVTSISENADVNRFVTVDKS